MSQDIQLNYTTACKAYLEWAIENGIVDFVFGDGHTMMSLVSDFGSDNGLYTLRVFIERSTNVFPVVSSSASNS